MLYFALLKKAPVFRGVVEPYSKLLHTEWLNRKLSPTSSVQLSLPKCRLDQSH